MNYSQIGATSLTKEPKAAHERYQYKPFIGSSHSWALKNLLKLTPEQSVLDIGSGSGAIGRELRAHGIKNLYAIEVDQKAKEAVRDIYLSVESDIAAYSGKSFDTILLLDVLEHVIDPVAFLNEATALLKSDGSILISLPNFAHWSVRFPLLFGYMKYQERGILDKTHLHFYTRKIAHQLVTTNSKLKIDGVDSSIEPIELILPRPLWNNALFRSFAIMRRGVARVLPGLFAYQHLIHAKKN